MRPKYKIGQRIQSGMTIKGVIDHGNTREAQYLVDGIEGPVEEKDIKPEEGKHVEPTKPHTGSEPAGA